MATSKANPLRELPSVDRLLNHSDATVLLELFPRDLVMTALRSTVDEERAALQSGRRTQTSGAAEILARARVWLDHVGRASLRPVVNATGVVLHTNLGRALLAEEAWNAVRDAATRACNLEMDLAGGERGERDHHIEEHLCALTGAEAAVAVNNNAAAVLLGLNTFADGREVIVSRGELVEIGGSFRIPEILAKSGARLREVGTTNRTHESDYERAIGADTALLLKVHPSNYRVEGFTAEVSLEQLLALGRARGLPVMEDLGSGALIDLADYGLPHEPLVSERVRLGVDVVTFSGDKVLGGPQAGILVGKRDTIEAIRRNPLKRALRCDKMTLAALEATLRLYRTNPNLAAVLPTLRLLTRPIAEMNAVASEAVPLVRRALGDGYDVEVVDAESQIGSGALPTRTLASRAMVISHPDVPAHQIAARFRAGDPPIIGRVHQDRFWLDLRCVEDAAHLVPSPPTPDT
jgi:L-seryl-tRNA(Ser) seleniumtransferase